ncbi:MAG TPA: UDP-N-acetylglucosamine 2-epimerase (non-hydrolyzing) [Firmicutes bacterium]|nr:UDP-N-acetylglucosamine 2-epimerase (non-hydrolyzing) [Bacillota bacterium]HHY97329.1 UDP-N-acetylglucosamine 2-epimerase (non-hydrolyzing) [Bacillota bacterium]
MVSLGNGSNRKKIMVIFGTRPEAIKMAPLVIELKGHSCFTTIVAVTAQHRHMLDQVLDLFDIAPDYDLDIMSEGQTLTDITIRCLSGLASCLEAESPDLVLVHGDTSTTMAGALSAFYHKIPVGHVEAGLRTGQKYSPYPEEMNRQLTAVLADLHFAPTKNHKENLIREGISPQKIFVTGNTVIDALLAATARDFSFRDPVLASIPFDRYRMVLVTAHRRENWGRPLEEILTAIRELVHTFPDLIVVFPVHMNPQVRRPAHEILGAEERVYLIDPVDYLTMVNLMKRCYLVLTDSGGMQEEAPSLNKPVLVLRDVTERPEGLASGTLRLAGTSKERILKEAVRLLSDRSAYAEMAYAGNPYGDGQACQRIVKAIKYYFGMEDSPPADFV